MKATRRRSSTRPGLTFADDTRLGLVVAVVCLAASGLAACGKASREPARHPEKQHGTVKDTQIVHEACAVDGAGARAQDVNGDGRSDLTTVFSGSQEVCRGMDLNFDGKIDVWVYRDASGQVRRRETDFDRDGRIDEIALFRNGQVFEKHRATTMRGELDTWQYFEKGRLTRAERDSDGDAMIDQWWEYPRSDKPECPLVHSDADNDGRPDPGSTVDLCAQEEDSYAEPPQAEPSEPVQPSGVPVELERPEPSGEPAETNTAEEPAQ